MTFLRKIIWPCYAVSLFLFLAVVLWGITGILGGGGHSYRIFSFYALIPGALFVIGSILGYKRAYLKWVFPVYGGLLARLTLRLALPGTGGWFPLISPILPFLFAAAGIVLGIVIGRIVQKISEDAKPGLKKALRVVIIVGSVIVLIHAVHAVTLDRSIQYKEVTFSSPRISPQLSGYRIGFIADTHFISDEKLQGIVDELNQRDLDMVVLGGDFSTDVVQMRRHIEILAQIEAGDGFFGVEGNHDTHRLLFSAMESQGMVPLSNEGVLVRENFFLAGVEDLWNRNPDISVATKDADADDFVLLIAHNPDITMKQDTTGVDLVLSGHTHGGQITFFGIWAPYLTLRSTISDYGQRFRTGWAESADGVPVLVSNGAGDYLPRVFARPQVIVLTLVHYS
ncbi:MAG: metallophosphoesterase [Oscillospiraceae bacterium]|nr:metallophosphoesterase [Oscillospiraceae bacterium]